MDSSGNPFDNSSQPIAGSGGGSSGSGSNFNWSSVISSGISGGTNVLTQVLKNQALGSQASANAKAAASTTNLIIIAVVGLLGLGVVFAFMNRR